MGRASVGSFVWPFVHPSTSAAARPTDTHTNAQRLQIELLRKLSVAERFLKVRQLTAWTVGLSKRAIARANPDLTVAEVNLKFIELHYGPELAQRVREYLNDR
jgi:hypothetical protein